MFNELNNETLLQRLLTSDADSQTHYDYKAAVLDRMVQPDARPFASDSKLTLDIMKSSIIEDVDNLVDKENV